MTPNSRAAVEVALRTIRRWDHLGTRNMLHYTKAIDTLEIAALQAERYREALETVCDVGDRAAVQVARAALSAAKTPKEER